MHDTTVLKGMTLELS